MIKKIANVATTLFLFLSLSANAAIPTWHIITNQSNISFSAAKPNSPIYGRLTKLSGVVHFDPSQLNKSNANVVIDLNAFLLGPKLRKNNDLSNNWFSEMSLLPNAVFKTNKMPQANDGTFKSKGLLKVQGGSLPLLVIFKVKELTATKLQIIGTTMLKRNEIDAEPDVWPESIQGDIRADFVILASKP